MKYFLSLFAVLVLIGAGCAQSSSETEAVLDVEETQPAVTIEVTGDSGTVVTETIVEVNSSGDSADIPVTEIILDAPVDVKVNMEADNFSFSPNTIKASPGDRVQITFSKNTGIHTFTIDEVDANFSITQGELFRFTAPDEPGEYAFYCDIGSHRSFGMEGTLIVE
jgi:plastocyanin